ncbi:Hypothetical predicted protein [Olea europaea subsp. europaea]|uniref:Uncharacterized protein n=1 Tax=Olea europaea subsp. europaea TaxID=158383 RepID=A0A8S0SQU2_OLEEU|nr:Hypothetical predicted protein [Olea europaea subsp. europaea]
MYLKKAFWSGSLNSESKSESHSPVRDQIRRRVRLHATISVFCHYQSIPELQVVPVLFRHSLKEIDEQRFWKSSSPREYNPGSSTQAIHDFEACNVELAYEIFH